LADNVLLFDIGTTTISGAIVDKAKAVVLSSASVLNGQLRLGDDLISRIDFALKNSKDAMRLQKAVVSSANKLLALLLTDSGLKKADIKGVFCVCNTGMHHLMLGINPAPLVTPPYRPAQKAEITVYAERIGIDLAEGCPITFLPNIGGFVGSDALSVIIAGGIYNSRAVRLAIDIGTNGEVILGNKDRIFAASTAAGPAFEGRHISCGSLPVKGAIEAVKIKGERVEIKVIGGGPPKGICGSGLIDAVSQMLKTGAVDKSGRISGGEFVIYERGKRKIAITQQDMRKVQLAKAAIYAAIKTLLRKSNIAESDIKEVLITGKFGNVINPDSIAAIGFIPQVPRKAVRFLKNGALEGLRLYLSRPPLKKGLAGILSKTRHIPLLGKGFTEDFTSSLFMG